MKKRENFTHFGFFCCTGALPLTYLSPIFIRRNLLVRDRQDLSRRIISTTSVCEVVVDLQLEIRVLQALLGIFETTAERVLPDDTRTATARSAARSMRGD